MGSVTGTTLSGTVRKAYRERQTDTDRETDRSGLYCRVPRWPNWEQQPNPQKTQHSRYWRYLAGGSAQTGGQVASQTGGHTGS